MRLIGLSVLLLFVIGCDQSELSVDNETSVAPDGTESAAPGEAHFERACASCHGGALKNAPHKDMIGLMTPEAILKTMTTGIMREESADLSADEKAAVAEFLSGDKLGAELARIPVCSDDVERIPQANHGPRNWGLGRHNRRTLSAEESGISSETIGSMQVKWTIAFPGANRVRSQPTIDGNIVFVGSHNGTVYSLDKNTGCQHWSFQAAGEVRTAIALDRTLETPLVFFGDVLANAYGVNADTGELVWRMRADEHPNATITGSPTPHDGRLYIPVSSLEVSLAVNPEYACCTFRGSVVAVDALTGTMQWKTYTIDEEPSVTGKNPIGTDIIGPSGAVVWNSPSIDVDGNQLFVGTGENMSSPASLTSDALIAMDLDSGDINWVFQATENDVWNTACDTDTPQNCPVEGGPDFDFGGATVIVETSSHGRIVAAGQKSGLVHAVNPDNGELIWQTRVGRGGIQGGIHFGIAASGETLLVPISDMADGRTYPNPDRPGMHALDANTGEILWSELHDDTCLERKYCHPGISQVVTVMGDVVIGGSMDGKVRAYKVASGELVWQLDTTAQPWPSITGEPATGGSFSGGAGPVAADGVLLLSSGYGIYNHMAGNLLLALEINQQKANQ